MTRQDARPLTAGARLPVEPPSEVLGAVPERIDLAKDPLYRVLHTRPADLEDVRCRRSWIRRMLAEQEREVVERSVHDANGNLTEAARRLGVHRVTLHKMVRRAKDE